MSQAFITILNMSINASYIILFVLVTRLLLKSAPKIYSYILWAVVFIRLAIPFSISSAFSFLKFFSTKTGSVEHIPMNITTTPNPTVDLGINSISKSINNNLTAFSHSASTVTNPIVMAVKISSIIWILGFAILLAHSVVTCLKLKKNVSTAILYKDNIYISSDIKSPFVLGFLKPKIYMPEELTGDAYNHILLHEQTHIKRFDYLIKPLAYLILCAHWFNPLVWVSLILMTKDMEMSCDESVISSLGSSVKKDYMQALLNLSIDKRTISGCPIAFGESDTKSRIKNVLNFKKPGFKVMAVVIILTTAVTFALGTNPKSTAIGDTPVSKISLKTVIKDYLPHRFSPVLHEDAMEFKGKWQGSVLPTLEQGMIKDGWLLYYGEGSKHYYTKTINGEVLRISLYPVEKTSITTNSSSLPKENDATTIIKFELVANKVTAGLYTGGLFNSTSSFMPVLSIENSTDFNFDIGMNKPIEGTYKVKNDKLILTSSDDKTQYQFSIAPGNNSFIIDQEIPGYVKKDTYFKITSVSEELLVKFTNAEINKAFETVNQKFKTFKGCTMTSLWYEPKYSDNFILDYFKNGRGEIRAENVIVLLSNFNVDSSGKEIGLTPNSTQFRWNWILVRDNKAGNWRVYDQGFNKN